MSAHPIDLVLFDLGGVLIDWNPDYLYAKLIPDARERELFLSEVCHPLWNHAQDAGRSWDDAVEDATAKFPDKADLIAAYRDRWAEMLGDSIPGTVALLEQLKRDGKVRLAALTNWSAETYPIAVERFGFLSSFEDVIVSGQEKVAKPNPRLYEIALERLGLEAKDILFIDDKAENIMEARMMGFHCIQFQNPVKLRASLREYGLI